MRHKVQKLVGFRRRLFYIASGTFSVTVRFQGTSARWCC